MLSAEDRKTIYILFIYIIFRIYIIYKRRKMLKIQFINKSSVNSLFSIEYISLLTPGCKWRQRFTNPQLFQQIKW